MPQIYGERTIRFVNPKTGAVKDVLERYSGAAISDGSVAICENVGPTANRPTIGMVAGYVYIDTTLNKAVFWVGNDGPVFSPGGANASGFWCDYTGAPA